MLTYSLENRGSVPIYDYLYQCIKDDIISGRLEPGEKLPSKRALARHLDIGIITVANAYAQLAVEGYISSSEKKGYFVENIGDYYTKKSKSANFAPEEKEHVYFADFKANRTSIRHFPLSTWSKLLRETLSEHNDALLETVPSNGVYQLRLAISNYLNENRGMEVNPSQIIIGAGTEYLYSRLMQMMGRACTFAIEDPGYKKFARISASFGNPWKYIPIDENGLIVDKLEESGADVVHVSPANHFPTGTVMPISRRLELFEWVNKIGKRYIIEDDYDSEFRYSGRYITPMFAQDVRNKVIYMNSFSKSLVPSLRISYMVLPPQLLDRYEKTQSFYSCTVSSFEQYTLARFISEGYFERHINKMRNYYRDQRTKILAAYEASPLSKISEIIERNAGTHFLLVVNSVRTEDEIRKKAAEENLQLSFYSDYSHIKHKDGKASLVINYAGISDEKIIPIFEKLSAMFPECCQKSNK